RGAGGRERRDRRRTPDAHRLLRRSPHRQRSRGRPVPPGGQEGPGEPHADARGVRPPTLGPGTHAPPAWECPPNPGRRPGPHGPPPPPEPFPIPRRPPRPDTSSPHCPPATPPRFPPPRPSLLEDVRRIDARWARPTPTRLRNVRRFDRGPSGPLEPHT